MSLMGEQVSKLRGVASWLDTYKLSNAVKVLNEAADTIEALSAKLASANMERSSAYYNDGWIPVDERLPEGENKKVIVSAIWDGYEYTIESYFYLGKFYNKPFYQIPVGEIKESYTGDKVIAWMPLPEPYKE